jgi:hypothetical protein
LHIAQHLRDPKIIHGVQHGYFGPRLLEVGPTILATLIDFDELSWKAWLHYPCFMRRKLDHLADHLRSTLQTYFQTPPEERKAFAKFTQKLEDEVHKAAIYDSDFNALMLFFYWGYVSLSINLSRSLHATMTSIHPFD